MKEKIAHELKTKTFPEWSGVSWGKVEMQISKLSREDRQWILAEIGDMPAPRTLFYGLQATNGNRAPALPKA